MKSEPFYLFLRKALKDSGLKSKDLVLMLEPKAKLTGKVLTTRTIERYLSGESCPDFSTAKIIRSLLNIDISDEELLDMLETTKIWANMKKNANANKYIDKHIMLKVSDFKEELGIDDNDEIIDLINQRIIELYGVQDKSGFGHYVRDLIIEDLFNKILPSGGLK